ncbi:MAG: endonuclease III [Clostridiales bacterium]|nr:endonuclease III [Clostridiales bacterium]
MLTPEKRSEALQRLAAAYPDAKPALEYASPFELLVAVVLSAQCTDVRVNLCTRELFPVANTPAAIAALGEEGLIPYIRSCGFFNTKAANVISLSRTIAEKYNGQVPGERAALEALPGVGRKTANVVLSVAFGEPAIAVDTHVFRVSNRIGLAAAKNVEKTEEQLMANIAREDWSKAHHWLIYHGRQVCKSQKPNCDTCVVHDLCTYRQLTVKSE